MELNPYIIAIGASAGGLKAITEIFDHSLPEDAAYVIIQHQSIDFDSQMLHILSSHSNMEFIEAEEHMEVRAGKIYLIPNDQYMVIRNNYLHLTPKNEKQSPHLTIDHFFLSLAEEFGPKAVGIILSGTGHDGSKGVEAIKSAGGMVIVQDPETAEFSGMPLSAVNTGCVDTFATPKNIPQIIESHLKKEISTYNHQHKIFEVSEKQLENIFNLIKKNSPFDFTQYKRPTILRRINRRMVLQNQHTAEGYYNYLLNNPAEVKELVNNFLISVTAFFRDPEAFKIIEKKVIPAILSRKSEEEVIKIWVPGCASGEEAYSIAILVKEYLNKTGQNKLVKIYATDINKSALAVASKGIYPESISETVEKERLTNFFTPIGTSYKINYEIRNMLVFAEHDLIRNVPYCKIDFISCRNLLIYMNLDLQEKAISMMHFGLKMNGYLFLGPSEHTSALKNDFLEISNKWNIFKNLKSGKPIGFSTFSSPVMGNAATTMEVTKRTTKPAVPTLTNNELNIAILEESGFNGICTNENLIVIRSFGDTSNYLKNINFNLNLNDLIPDHIAIPFKAAAHKALKLNQRIELKGLLLKDQATDIVIRPFYMNNKPEIYLLILFKENKEITLSSRIITDGEFSELAKEHLISLEQELAEAKMNLEAAKEWAASSNESMQSFNEEQQSANEEMQSANEELQSVNEELHTINKEYQVTNGQLMELNDDLNNYFRSNTSAQLFVDRHLLLRKHSPWATKHLNIRESDVGAHLSSLITNLKYDTLVNDINKVIKHGKDILREAETLDGKTFEVLIVPYLRKNVSLADGAVISFCDITELKKLRKELAVTKKLLKDAQQEIKRLIQA